MTQRDIQYPSANWRLETANGVSIWRSDALTDAGVAHAFTGGGYNMSATKGPDAAASPVRRRNVCKLIGANYHRLAIGGQCHGTRVERIQPGEPRRGIPIPDCDGLITDEALTPLLGLSADCPLIVIVDPARPALGIAHSGWRGTVDKMPERLIEQMRDTFDTNSANAIAVIAPCAKSCCYEIKQDVRALVEAASSHPAHHIRTDNGAMYLELGTLIAEHLTASGLSPDRIHLPDQCTICDRRFYSYRRLGNETGHAGLMACVP